MSKLIALALLVVSLTLVSASCNREQPTPSANQNSSQSSAAAAQEMEVTILFSGLMVLNRKSDGNFEMGILGDGDVQKEHKFCVRQASASKVICQDDMKEMGTGWSFTVKDQTGSSTPSATPIPSPYLGGEGPRPKRRPDDEAGQYDFNWIIHFDGPEFHGDEPLELDKGHLNPIIQLPKGQFFTRHKSYDLIRKKGDNEEPAGAFGFVAETTGLYLTLKRGQELLLLDQNGEKILSVPYAPPHPNGSNSEIISFTNVRPYPSKESDFYLYYNLFRNEKFKNKSNRYDFYRNENQYPCPDRGNKDPCYPHNMVPHDENAEHKAGFRTCCAIDCTKIYLSRSGRALE